MEFTDWNSFSPSLEDIEAIASFIPQIKSRPNGTTNYYWYEENSQGSGNLAKGINDVNVSNKEIHEELPAVSYAWIQEATQSWCVLRLEFTDWNSLSPY